MGARVKLFLLFLCVVGFSAELLAQVPEASRPSVAPTPAAVEVRATVDQAEVTIGTPFKYKLEVRIHGEAEIVVPVLAGQLGAFSIVDFGPETREQRVSTLLIARWYKLVAYSPGDLLIPAPAVQYRTAGGGLESVSANEVAVRVVSLVGKDKDLSQLDVRDIRQPKEAPVNWRFLGLLAISGVALVLAGLAIYRWANRRHYQVAAVPVKPSHEVALEALARLRQRRLLEEGRVEEYYVELSTIVREYLEACFRLHAPEMTTEEFLLSVQGGTLLNATHKRILGDFLSESDLVKFARYVPSCGEAERAFDAAHRFVNESRPGA